MLTNQRHALILDRLRRDRQIVATAMAAELGVSEDTIRRDLRELAGDGKLTRVHGGAVPAAPSLPDLSTRMTIGTDVKRALGLRAITLVTPRMTLFLDGGTTNEALVRALPRDLTVTVVTHSPTIAAALAGHDAEVILIGGRLYKHSMVTTGAAMLGAIDGMRFDLFLLGATALHPAHGATTGDFEEAAVKRAVAARSALTYILAAPEKFGAVSPHRILPLSALTGLIVSAQMGDADLAPYRDAGLTVVST